ncbi:hypothetical protein [Fodinibius salsisoli]|uniref:DUF1579 domain-containing protein n=1 Tax=Fodinibius salsisoli TaxID=2820877 RepID=A0ABT3PJ67_9BACT|nr:hypothetical protein [Fodinibius salsisoli]MCW9705982.1 hypothetical protein [Fodinibius salsisoli]
MDLHIPRLLTFCQRLLLSIIIFPLVLSAQPQKDKGEQAGSYPEISRNIDPAPAGPSSYFSCSSDTVRNQFNFWIGEWNVFVDGEKTAVSHIERTLDGCMILENYRNLKNGFAGKSMNFYDPKRQEWIQIWTDNQGNVSRYRGNQEDGNMYFSGINTLRDGTQTKVRMEFIPRKDGSVRQIYEQSTDGGSTWETLFDGIYRSQK